MKLSTVKIRNKKTGATTVINEVDWAHDLGRGQWRGWERYGEMHTGLVKDKLVLSDNMDTADKTLHKAVLDSIPQGVDIEEPSGQSLSSDEKSAQQEPAFIINEQAETVNKPRGVTADSDAKKPRRRRRRKTEES